jgi:tetratricopeptide (TPR) repeat protein
VNLWENIHLLKVRSSMPHEAFRGYIGTLSDLSIHFINNNQMAPGLLIEGIIARIGREFPLFLFAYYGELARTLYNVKRFYGALSAVNEALVQHDRLKYEELNGEQYIFVLQVKGAIHTAMHRLDDEPAVYHLREAIKTFGKIEALRPDHVRAKLYNAATIAVLNRLEGTQEDPLSEA